MAKQRRMRIIQTLFVVLLVVAFQVRQDAAQNQNTDLGRVVGRVLDQSGAVLPGANVTMTGRDGTARHVVTDINGRFAFDGVTPDVAYSVRGVLPGFATDEERDITITAGQTRTVALELYVLCCGDGGLTVERSDLAKLLSADAIAHVRMGDAGEDLRDGYGPSREAVVLKAVLFSKAGQGLGATVRVMGADRFQRGKEYLVILGSNGGFKHPRVGVEFMREVVGGRIRGESAADLDIHDGMRVEDALKRLQEIRERQGR